MSADDRDETSHLVFRARGINAGFSEQEGFLKDVSLEVKSGERVAIMGSDHLARGQLIRVLVGLRLRRSGDLEVLEHEVRDLPHYTDWDKSIPQSVRRRIGVCLETEGLLNNVSVREGLEFLFRFKYGDHTEKLRQGASKVVTETCAKFGLGTAVEKRPFLLTSAEKRLAGLARAFLTKPKVLVLENPSQSIGDSSREKLYRAMEHMTAAEDRTLVVSTEDWALARQFCPRWIVLEESRVTFDGLAADFLKSSHPLLAQLRAIAATRDRITSLIEEIAA